MQNFFSVLAHVSLFQGISEQDLQLLLSCLNGSYSRYTKDSFILLEGDPISGVGIICEGEAQLIKEDVGGNRILLDILHAGDLFGEAFVAAKVDSIPIHIRAAQPCTILTINYRKVITTCPSSCAFHSKMIENMLGILAQKNLFLTLKNNILSARSIREKILSYLATQAKQSGTQPFSIPFNRQELADYLSVDRSALSRELHKMKTEGIISFQKNQFALP